MKTKIIKIKGSWEEIVNDCRSTVSKPPLGHEPSSDFKRRMMIAEHEPIRDIIVKFRWEGIKYWCAMHWKTHIWPGRTNTQRNDRQDNYDRNKAPQDVPVDFTGDPNLQHLIDTWRKRLCYMADPETRGYAEDFKAELRFYEPEASDALVPNCVYRCGCPEGGKCQFFAKLVQDYPNVASIDIQRRYDAYNEYFYERVVK
jgi:hypothetical protein